MKKARVKATGEIVDVEKTILRGAECYINTTGEKIGHIYMEYELDFNIDGKFAENCFNVIKQGIVYNPYYWTRLEHQYAGMAMQGLMTILPNIGGLEGRTPKDEIVDIAMATAHALVQKLKEKEERK